MLLIKRRKSVGAIFLVLHKKLWDLFFNLFNLSFVVPSHSDEKTCWLLGGMTKAYSATMGLLGFCGVKKTPGGLMG